MLKEITTRVQKNVILVDELAGGLESLALTVAARIATWIAALPTIALAARTINIVFALDLATAWASAIALELVGQSVVNSWLRAKEWNANKAKSEASANEGLLLSFCALYFATDFLLVGALELPKALAGEWVHFTALLFPLMQVVSTVVTAERAAQYRRETAAQQAKAERTERRTGSRKRSPKRSENVQLNVQQERAVVHKTAPSMSSTERTPVQSLEISARRQERSAVRKAASEGAPAKASTERRNGHKGDTSTVRAERTPATVPARAASRQAAMRTLLNAFAEDPYRSYSEVGRIVGRSKSWVAGAITDLESHGVLQRSNGSGVLVNANVQGGASL